MASYYPRPFGRYWLLKPLAEGGMGALHVAAIGDPGLEKLCVIKTLLPDRADEDYLARFMSEAQVVVRLSHGNLVPVLDVGRVDEQLYLAMEYVEGKDLRAVWNRCAQVHMAFPVDVAVHLVKEVVRGLHYAHNAPGIRLVHRDVSPQNILLSFAGEIKLADFGLAKSTLSTVDTELGVIYGKLPYMSPEQARDEELDPRSDLYSAGIILWELLTGRQLFQGNSLDSRQRQEPMPPPSTFSFRVTPELDELVQRALMPLREDRFPDGEAMRAALAGWLARHAPTTDASRVARFLQDLYGDEIDRERTETRLLLSGLKQHDEDPAPKAVPLLAPGVLVEGRYLLKRIIGEGGMGQVWEAEHVQIGRPVAIKFLRSIHARGQVAVAAFRREARAPQAIRHRNVASVTDASSFGDTLYLVMELLVGTTLSEELLRTPTLDVRRVLHIGYQIADTLVAAHESGVVHRDLKPANIFLIPEDSPTGAGPAAGPGDESATPPGVKVLDFGIALTLLSDRAQDLVSSGQAVVTPGGIVAGTLDYMAPEQVAGAACDGRADIYSLGVMLYRMLSGSLPIAGDTPEEQRQRKLTQDPVDLLQIAPRVPAELSALVMRTLRRDQNERFATMREVADALSRMEAEITTRVKTLPEGGSGSTVAPPHRTWLWAGLSAAFGMGLLTGLGFFIHSLQQGTLPPDLRAAADGGQEVADLATPTLDLRPPPDMAAPQVDRRPPDLGISPPDLRTHSPGPHVPPLSFQDALRQLQNGRTDLGKGHYVEAAAACEDALRNARARCQALTCLSEVAFARGDFHGAVQAGERAVRCSKGGIQAHLVLGNAYLREHKPLLAREQYQAVRLIDPENAEANEGIKKTYQSDP